MIDFVAKLKEKKWLTKMEEFSDVSMHLNSPPPQWSVF